MDMEPKLVNLIVNRSRVEAALAVAHLRHSHGKVVI